MLPLVYIFEEVRSILLNNVVNYSNIMPALALNLVYFASLIVFWLFVNTLVVGNRDGA